MQSDATGVACPNEKVKPCCLKFIFFFSSPKTAWGCFFENHFGRAIRFTSGKWLSLNQGVLTGLVLFQMRWFFFFHFSPHQQKWHQNHESKETAWKQGNGIKARKQHQSKETAWKQENSLKARKQHQSKELGNTPRKNWGIHIAAFLSRQPLVKGERLVRYEVNAVMPQGGLETSTSIFKGEEVLLTNHLWRLQWALNPGSSKKACVTASARVWYLEPKWLR